MWDCFSAPRALTLPGMSHFDLRRESRSVGNRCNRSFDAPRARFVCVCVCCFSVFRFFTHPPTDRAAPSARSSPAPASSEMRLRACHGTPGSPRSPSIALSLSARDDFPPAALYCGKHGAGEHHVTAGRGEGVRVVEGEGLTFYFYL